MPPSQAPIPPPPPMAGLQTFSPQLPLASGVIESDTRSSTIRWLNGKPRGPADEKYERYRQDLLVKLEERRKSQEKFEVVLTGIATGRDAASPSLQKPVLPPKPELPDNLKPVARPSAVTRATGSFTSGGPQKSKSLIEALEAEFKRRKPNESQTPQMESAGRSV